MDRYEARLMAGGSNARERALNKFRRDINTKAIKNGSYKDVKINGVDSNLIIDDGTQPYYKKYTTMPNGVVNIGDYIEWSDSIWIVVTRDSDDEVVIDGQMHECNYLLKWQNAEGDIVERWCEKKSASKYNDGESGSNFIILGSDQLSITVPIDNETLRLKKDMNMKFFIDENKENPTVYELTGTGNEAYKGHGLCSWIMKETQYTPTKEELTLGVCNYSSKETPSSTNKNIIPNILCAKKSIKYGGKRTFTAEFKNVNGEIVDEIPIWTIANCTFLDNITTEESDNTITITVPRDDNLWGETFDLTLTSVDSESITITIEITE